MQYTQLERRGPRVFTIGFSARAIGGMNWGPTDDQVSLKALHTALYAAVTFIEPPKCRPFNCQQVYPES